MPNLSSSGLYLQQLNFPPPQEWPVSSHLFYLTYFPAPHLKMLKKFLHLLNEDRKSFYSAKSTQNWSMAGALCLLPPPKGIYLAEPWTRTIHWPKRDAMRWGCEDRTARHWTDAGAWRSRKRGGECAGLQVLSRHVNPAVLSVFTECSRVPSYEGSGQAQSHSRWWTALLGSVLAWFGGSLGRWLGSWPRSEGAVWVSGHQLSRPGTGSALVSLVQT